MLIAAPGAMYDFPHSTNEEGAITLLAGYSDVTKDGVLFIPRPFVTHYIAC